MTMRIFTNLTSLNAQRILGINNDRLAQSMSGESARRPAGEEALEAERIWLGLYALPEEDFSAFGKRIKQALSDIMETV